ncbi:hypothetical protein AB0O27_37565, partial [Streptomyces hydrogenans]
LPRSSSARIPHPSTGDVPGGASGRTPYPGSGDLPRSSSARIPHPSTGDVPGGASGRTPYPGSGDVPGAASGRTPYPGSGDLPRSSSARIPHPASGDVGGAASGRTARPGAGDVTAASSGRPGGRPGGAADLGERASGRTSRPDDGHASAGDRSGARVPRPGGEEDHLPRPAAGRVPLPRLVVLVDDFDALVAPALGAPGRPAAGSVVRALEAVARHGERLGVHLIATSARPDRTVDTDLAHGARLRVVLDAPPGTPGPDVPAPGRGRLGHPDGRVTPFQAGRVTGRIPRTATQRPTVVPLEWERMGDPPARRPVRELGNGPTDLALLASALDRAARSVEAAPVPPLTHA